MDNEKIVMWAHYIDDILILYIHLISSFEQFVKSLNVNPIGLQFTHEINEYVLPFLDILIFKNIDGTLATKVHFLRWKSCQPRPLLRGIPRGQYLRMRCNCSDLSSFKKQAHGLRARFDRRDYPRSVLKEAYSWALRKECNSLLIPKRTIEMERNRNNLKIIGRFDTYSQEVRKILSKYWNFLLCNKALKRYY